MINKVVITGAASGLGKALALHYAQHGGQICVVDLDAEQGGEVVQLIEQAGGQAFFQSCDITQQTQVDQLAEVIQERWGSFSILINNAGVATGGLFENEEIEAWQWVMDINLLGHVRVTKALLPLIKINDSVNRSVVNIASQAGLTLMPGLGSYAASKAAMVSLSETLYLELGHDDIHVSVVCPSFFKTNLNKSLRTSQPGIDNLVDKLMKKSDLNAEQIAEKIFVGVSKKNFMILPHADGRKTHLMKRFLPIDYYLSIIKKKTKRLVKKEAG